ncbi:MAG: zinc-ribbon domain-containing protein [Ruminococcus sp.]|nr:zinc-ribbon domain-containing protein [Ruminococcus sp.]
MAFCSNCGKELSANDKFCSECGTPVQGVTASQRKTVYDGELHKCPNCGEVLDSFSSVCPTCGYEIRGATNSIAAREFAMRLEKAGSQQEKITIIRNYPIPNTKEDIFEFLILASSNISDNLDNGISKAWQSKVEQAYQKAQLVFKNSDEFAYIQSIYNQVMRSLPRLKQLRT